MALTYGLGRIDFSGLLALSAPGAVVAGRDFVLTAYVYEARDGQTATIDLPAGLRLAPGESATKVIHEGGKRAAVFWRVRGEREGAYTVAVRTPSGRVATEVRVRAVSIFG